MFTDCYSGCMGPMTCPMLYLINGKQLSQYPTKAKNIKKCRNKMEADIKFNAQKTKKSNS